jgi:hypothetical protein
LRAHATGDYGRLMLRLIAVSALAAGALAAVPAAASAQSCPGGFNPDGSKGDFYSRLRVTGTGCAAGRKVMHRWVVRMSPGTGNPTRTVTVKRYTCSGRSTAGHEDMDGGLKVRCVKGAKVVRFYGHP